MVTQQCPAGPSCWLLDVDPEHRPAERLDISDRDPDTLTPLEKLAHAYPDVYALVQQHDAEVAAISRLRETWRTRLAPARASGQEWLVRLFVGLDLAEQLDALDRQAR